jgi:hypothetical protein
VYRNTGLFQQMETFEKHSILYSPNRRPEVSFFKPSGATLGADGTKGGIFNKSPKWQPEVATR